MPSRITEINSIEEDVSLQPEERQRPALHLVVVTPLDEGRQHCAMKRRLSPEQAAVVARAEASGRQAKFDIIRLRMKIAHRHALQGEMLRGKGDWLEASQHFGRASTIVSGVARPRFDYLRRQVQCLLDHGSGDVAIQAILEAVPELARALDEVQRCEAPEEWEALRSLLGEAYAALDELHPEAPIHARI